MHCHHSYKKTQVSITRRTHIPLPVTGDGLSHIFVFLLPFFNFNQVLKIVQSSKVTAKTSVTSVTSVGISGKPRTTTENTNIRLNVCG